MARVVAAKESAEVHIAEQARRIDQSRLNAAEPMAVWAGTRARTFRPDSRVAIERIDPHDAAPAGPDRGDLNLRDAVMIAVDDRLARVFQLAVLDDTYLEGGAAHVRGDDVGVAKRTAEPLTTDDARGWPAF